MLIGHRDQQRAFLSAMAEGRAHHAWLLAGPKGLGKAAFAIAAATHVLARAAGPADGIDLDSLHVAPDHRVARLMREPEPADDPDEQGARPHPDFRMLKRRFDAKKGKMGPQILIDDMRAFNELFHSRGGYSEWRVGVIDAAEDLREGAANTLLKTLEEPPPHTLMLLVSHAPGRLLPTIRSRCRLLRFQPLADEEVAAVLRAERPGAPPDDIAALVRLAEGSPGRALRFAGLDVAGLEAALDALARQRSSGRALDLAKSLAGVSARPRYEAFLELAPAYLARAAKSQAAPSSHRTVELWETANRLAAEALPLQLQPEAVAFELASLVGEIRG